MRKENQTNQRLQDGGQMMRARVFLSLIFLLITSVVKIESEHGKVEPRGTISRSLRSDEVCQMEEFKATCEADEVIVVRSAELGRLKLGRCVKEEKYEVGCSLDVLLEMDRLCSGRRECVVKVDDKNFKRDTNCHQDLKNHLWISYECIKVTIPSDRCDALRQQSGILSNFVTETTRCGVTDTPWVIEVNRGQRINITLFDFASAAFHSSGPAPEDDAYPRRCRVYATIREAGSTLSHSRTVCGGPERVSGVFLSSSEKIEVRILTARGAPKPNPQQYEPVYFLLQFNVVGCADPVLPKDAWMRRLSSSSDIVTIGCDQSSFSWQLTCKDNEWKGYHGNCSSDRSVSAALGMPYAISTMIIVIIALTVSCVILTIGVLCIKKRIVQEREVRRLQREIRSQCEADYGLGVMSEDKLNLDAVNASAILVDPSGNEYARMRLQRMTDYAGSPPYGFDAQSYGAGCGYKYPTVEHVYESPDSLRREDSLSRTNPHYMSRIHDQRGPPGPAVVAGAGKEIVRSGRPSSPRAVHPPLSPVQEPFRVTPGTPNKSKNVGNYSL